MLRSRRRRAVLGAVGAALWLGAGGGWAAVVLNEPFNYGASDLLGTLTGTGAAGYGWQDNNTTGGDYDADITASWSGDAAYHLNGAGGSLVSVGTGLNAYRGVQRTLGTTLSGTFWMSVLMMEEGAGSSVAGINVAFDSGTYSSAQFDSFAFGINGSGNLSTAANSTVAPAAVAGPVPMPTGWGLYVAKITVNASANDSISLWAFDSADSFDHTELSLGAPVYSSSSVQYGNSVSAVWLGAYRAGSTQGSGHFDNVRISNLGDDRGLYEVLSGMTFVAPEPFSVVLLGLGAGLVRVLGGRRFRLPL